MIFRSFTFFIFNFTFASAVLAGNLAVPLEGVDFGEIVAGANSEISVPVRNIGNRDIRISRVKPCCGAEASLSSMVLKPGAEAELTVKLSPSIPGQFSKTVHIYCDDPQGPVVAVPIVGTAVASSSSNVASRYTLPAVVLAGVADGFNPCAFSIVIALAGILAVGGRRRRARMLGGWAFCLGSFLTYMAMGLGLMRAIRALDGFSTLRMAFMGVLSLSLFILSFLSIRDAFRYRRAKVPSVITLQLPERVKKLIRVVAETSWNGPTVVVAGLGCGVLVTLLDSLCTGQIYVPVLALISREPGAWRSFALLAIYNLAFIAPLVAVFMLAAKGADAAQMSRWSKRNVFPSKIGLGVMFAALGVLVLLT